MSERIRAAAERIASHRRARRPLGVLPETMRPRDIAEGYAVQAAVEELLVERGPRVGYKIGCTTPVMRTRLGIDHPCYAGIPAGGRCADGARLSPSDYCRPGVECELAVTVARDGARSFDDVAGFHAAIEIVDNRYGDWLEAGVPTLIADDFFAAGFILGPAHTRHEVADPSSITGSTVIGDTGAGEGTAADVLGDPERALAWLANELTTRGQELEAGDIVLLGSLVAVQWLAPGDTAAIVMEPLGTLRMSLASGK